LGLESTGWLSLELEVVALFATTSTKEPIPI
jgi:hypothetical protein